MVEVHQLHPSVSYGDAIGNEMLAIRDMLVRMGYKSEIYAQFIDPRMKNVRPFQEYRKSSSHNNILIVHYSIGYGDELLDFVKTLPDKKIMIYHNITPPEFFHGISPDFEAFTKAGREELSKINYIFDMALGDSEYNRMELAALGYRNTDVLPIALDFSKYDTSPDCKVISKYDDDFTNILFVGRVSPNKKQEDVIRAFYYYKKYINVRSRLFLVGSSTGMDKYSNYLSFVVDKLGLKDVHLIGHVSFEELLAYYKLADVFLCMSEHEGFCVPLVECMYLKTPIIAYDSTAVPYTLGGSGIQVKNKDFIEIAELINLLMEDDEIRDSVIKGQLARLDEISMESPESLLGKYIESVVKSPHRLNVQVEGTFEDSYSLSVINRNLALALDGNGCDVSLYPTTGTGDYLPDGGSIKDAKTKELWMKMNQRPEFSIRNIYPPITKDIKGRYKLIYFYWEESRIPKEWVRDFNKLDGIIVASEFIKKVLIDNGVKTRIEVIPNGVNIGMFAGNIKPMPLNTNKKFKFLNISSGFPRKGIDVLIKAYTEEFTKDDDVCLIIKSFPNIHNKISDTIKEHAGPNSPEIIYIDRDLPEASMASLYHACDCFVSPTRGEGFGLPMAEAMLSRIPVIATNYSGHVDFCKNDNSFLIDYRLETSKTHLRDEYKLDGSIWAEPDLEHLKRTMRHVYVSRDSAEVRYKTDRAYEEIKHNYSWDTTANKVIRLLEDIRLVESAPKLKVGLVSTWNVKCGIAEYTRYLSEGLSKGIDKTILANRVDRKELIRADEPYTVRCWDVYSKDHMALYNTIKSKGLDVIHFQFNFGFFELKSLANLIKKLKSDGKKVIVTFHATTSATLNGKKIVLAEIKDELKLADMLWVHTQRDIEKLNSIGLKENVCLIPQGYQWYPDVDKETAREGIFSKKMIISTFGFFLPHKGIMETVEAFAEVNKKYPESLLLVCSSIYPSRTSIDYHRDCLEKVKALGLTDRVVFITDFLDKDEIIYLLQASDMVVLAYKETGESSSAAIRTALATHRPVIVTDIPIFSEFNSDVYKIRKSSPEDIAKGIIDLYNDDELQKKITTCSTRTIKRDSWDNVSKKYEHYLGIMGKSQN